jgi:hypothetical protein
MFPCFCFCYPRGKHQPSWGRIGNRGAGHAKKALPTLGYMVAPALEFNVCGQNCHRAPAAVHRLGAGCCSRHPRGTGWAAFREQKIGYDAGFLLTGDSICQWIR